MDSAAISERRSGELCRQMPRDDLDRLPDQVGALDWGILPEKLNVDCDWHAIEQRGRPQCTGFLITRISS